MAQPTGTKLVRKCISKISRYLATREGRFSVILLVPDVAEQRVHCVTAGLTFEQFNDIWQKQDKLFREHPDAVMAMVEVGGRDGQEFG